MRIIFLLWGLLLLIATGAYALIAKLKPELLEDRHVPTDLASYILIIIMGTEHALLLLLLGWRRVKFPGVKVRSPFQL